MNSALKRVYITTPIFYVNASPHIGHLHSTLLADTLTRYHKLRKPAQPSPILLTGTDEHGLKIQTSAQALNLTPTALCDDVSTRFKKLAKAGNIDYSIFLRTTQHRHKLAVQHIWSLLEQRGHIYKSSYAGYYSVSDEAYYSPNQVEPVPSAVSPVNVEGENGEVSGGAKRMRCIETGSAVQWMEEKNYKFRLSTFKTDLVDWISAEPYVLQPPNRTTALLASLTAANSTDLADLSISRPSSRLQWGIPVPNDDSQTIYVWIDALVNYLTGVGYPWSSTVLATATVEETDSELEAARIQELEKDRLARKAEAEQLRSEGELVIRSDEGEKIWPPDVMVIGKDIIKFHALYFPAMLMALDLPLPKKILAHGHWTMDKFKMSKSRGNVADPIAAMELCGTDAFRCFLMRRGAVGSDNDYSIAELSTFYKKDLAGQVGNLLARLTSDKLLKKMRVEHDGIGELFYESPKQEEFTPEDVELLEQIDGLPHLYAQGMNDSQPSVALSSIFRLVANANRHFQSLKPWDSTVTSSGVHRAAYLAYESLRLSAILLSPTMPTKSTELLDTLGVPAAGRTWESLRRGGGDGERCAEAAERVGKRESSWFLFSPVEFVDPNAPIEVKGSGQMYKRVPKKKAGL